MSPLAKGAFPYNQDTPARLAKIFDIAPVTGDVRIELGPPELCACRWDRSEPTSLVAMPETTMNKDGYPMAAEDNVGPTRQITRRKHESEAQSMQRAPELQLRLRVPAANCGHVSPPLGRDLQILRARLGNGPRTLSQSSALPIGRT